MSAPLRRRSFIQATGASIGALSLRGFAVGAPAAAHFTHGIASGDPLADRVILWTRVLPGSGDAKAMRIPCGLHRWSRKFTYAVEGPTLYRDSREY